MRASLPTMILSLAAALTWLGWSAVPAEAQAPGGCPYSDNLAYSGQGQCLGQDQGAEPAGLFAGLCDPCDGGPRWVFTAETVALQRSTTRSQALLRDNFGSTSNVLLDSKFVDFPLAYGPKLSAICRSGCGWDLEVAYFQMDGFAARAFVPGASFLVTDVNGANFAVDDIRARYTSALYNGELNVRHEYCDWLTLLAGFRMGQLNEHYSAMGAGAIVRPTLVSLDANTLNHLYGFQLGADVKVFDLGGPWQINALCKAGIYDNVANQNIHQVDTDPTRPTNQFLSARGNRAAFLGEAGVVATYALTQHVAFRASLEAAWLEGVALAPEQIGATNFAAGTASVLATGGVSYYGGGLGIECRF
jgi:hypothetical protein